MAKRTLMNSGMTSNQRKRGRPSKRSIELKSLQEMDLSKLSSKNAYKKTMQVISEYPVVWYLAGSVGAFFLGRLAYRYYQDHPEISEFFRDNFDTIEGRLRELRGGDSEDTMARH